MNSFKVMLLNKTKTKHPKTSQHTPRSGTLPRAELRRIVAEMVG